MMCFTGFLPDPMMQFNVGYVSCFLVVTHLAINLSIMLMTSLHQITLRLKKLFYQHQLKKKRAAGISHSK